MHFVYDARETRDVKDTGQPLPSFTEKKGSPLSIFSLLIFLPFSFLLLFFAGGCGSSTPNPDAPFSRTKQQHAADWLPAGHMVAAQKDESSCAGCHGEDLTGGIVQVSCTGCHLGGATSIHPLDWSAEQKWSNHAAYAATLGNSGCANARCHGPELEGVAGSGPSCSNCHLDGVDSKHPRVWGQHAAFLHGEYLIENGGAKCSNAACHGADLTGVAGSGSGCGKCHALPPHKLTDDRSAGCSTCHDEATTAKLRHPWNAPTFVNHRSYLAGRANDTKPCANAACHGTELKGGESANCPSCESCHLGGVIRMHPESFGTGTTILTVHQTYVAQNSTKGCANAACHGSALQGVTNSGPSCASCHLDPTSKHPIDFGGTPALNHKAYVDANQTAGCAAAACHGADLAGGTTGPSCTSCHLGGPALKHPDPASYGKTNPFAGSHNAFIAVNAVNGKDGMEGCRNNYCHGADLAGVTGSGSACTTCHKLGSPAVLKNCESCHGKPPKGGSSPDNNGAHGAHNALPGVTNVCDTCHSGAGSGAASHFNGQVDLQVMTTFNAKSGAAAWNSGDRRCSNVSCHGGKTTPVWGAESINVDLDCTTCHSPGTAAGTPENNSYYSGRHQTHMESHAPKFCGSCHDQTKLSPIHFAHLDTPQLDTPASVTLRVPQVIASYDPQARTCTTATGCHFNPTSPRPW